MNLSMIVRDIDIAHVGDIVFVPEYAAQFWDQLLRHQWVFTPGNIYTLSRYENIRREAIKFLFKCFKKCGAITESFYLGVHILDRCLLALIHEGRVLETNIDILILAALRVGIKYEEIAVLPIADYLEICGSHLSHKRFKDAELRVCQTIDFNLTVPTVSIFLIRFGRAGASDSTETLLLAAYLCELSVMSTQFLRYVPAMVAAAAILISRMAHNYQKPWSETLEFYSGFSELSLGDCVKTFVQIYKSQIVSGHPKLDRLFTILKSK
jgi:hypothetical protein